MGLDPQPCPRVSSRSSPKAVCVCQSQHTADWLLSTGGGLTHRVSVRLAPDADCYENDGAGYRGTASVTHSGARCLPWNSDLLTDELHVDNVESAALLGIGEHAFCRRVRH